MAAKVITLQKVAEYSFNLQRHRAVSLQQHSFLVACDFIQLFSIELMYVFVLRINFS